MWYLVPKVVECWHLLRVLVLYSWCSSSISDAVMRDHDQKQLLFVSVYSLRREAIMVGKASQSSKLRGHLFKRNHQAEVREQTGSGPSLRPQSPPLVTHFLPPVCTSS